jgi:hypothetical protein
MGDLRPLGSEKLQGMDKIRRIMEIARYNEVETTSINENETTDYTIQLADGNFYGIVREKSGYIVKKGLTESTLDYIEPMKNRKYHKSFSQAMRKINLVAGELNRLHENEEGVNLIGEQKKFVLKTPKTEVPAEAPAEEPSMDLPSEPAPMAEPTSDTGLEDLDFDLSADTETPDGEEEMNLDLGVEEPAKEGEEEVSIKVIQKLTGKLGQKIRTLDTQQGMSSEDIKYVLNSILSALDLSKLTEEDYDDVMVNFEEEDAIDYGVEDEADLDVEVGDELDFGVDTEVDMDSETQEMTEDDDMYLGIGDLGFYDKNDRQMKDFDFDYDEEEYDDFDEFVSKYPNQNWFPIDDRDERPFDFKLRPGREFWDRYKTKFGGPFKLRKRRPMGEEMDMDTLPSLDFEEQTIEVSPDEIKSELHSTIDQVLSKYFAPSEEEQQMFEQKETKKFLNNKVKNVIVKNQIKTLSESVEQEMTAEFILKEHNNVKFLGKTNKNNLVFEADNVQLKVSTKGEIL